MSKYLSNLNLCNITKYNIMVNIFVYNILKLILKIPENIFPYTELLS